LARGLTFHHHDSSGAVSKGSAALDLRDGGALVGGWLGAVRPPVGVVAREDHGAAVAPCRVAELPVLVAVERVDDECDLVVAEDETLGSRLDIRRVSRV
jgi:hypothetical protein